MYMFHQTLFQHFPHCFRVTWAMGLCYLYHYRVSILGNVPFQRNMTSNGNICCIVKSHRAEALQNLMVGQLFQNYDTIYVQFFPTFTCNHSCYTIYVRFFCHVYTCVLSCFVGFSFPGIWPFSYKRVYMCAQKSPHICVTNKHVVYGVTESRRIRGTELYRQQKTPSCTMALKSNFSLNQAWPQWPR